MSIYRIKKGASPLAGLVQKSPIEKALTYVREAWDTFVEIYQTEDPPLASRNERQLTEGFGIFLDYRKRDGKQPIEGFFLPEVTTGELFDNGMPGRSAGRVDLAWYFRDAPAIHIEFKIIDGTNDRYRFYLYDGLIRFPDEIYGRRMMKGAMCALVRPGVTDPVAPIVALIEGNPVVLDCHPAGQPPIWKPSLVGGDAAAFDTVHQRQSTGSQPIKIAHMFFSLPPVI